MKPRTGGERRAFQVVHKRKIVHAVRPPVWRPTRRAEDGDLSGLMLYGQA